MTKAVFLDRDGLINRQAEPHHYITSWNDFDILPGVGEAIRLLNEAGFLVIIVTNQRGVARGMMSMKDVDDIHIHFRAEMERQDAHIDGIYVCPHNEGECHCRKPDIGLFLQAEQDFDIDKSKSWMIGDSESDVLAGQNYGIKTLHSSNLLQAVNFILNGGNNQ